MDRIQGVTVAPGNQFTEGNPATATPATIVSAEWLNGVQEELIAIIVAAGLTPGQATLTQVRDAIAASYAPKTSTSTRLGALETTATSQGSRISVAEASLAADSRIRQWQGAGPQLTALPATNLTLVEISLPAGNYLVDGAWRAGVGATASLKASVQLVSSEAGVQGPTHYLQDLSGATKGQVTIPRTIITLNAAGTISMVIPSASGTVGDGITSAAYLFVQQIHGYVVLGTIS